MSRACLYLQLHQPFRLTEQDIFQLGQSHDYAAKETDQINHQVFTKVAAKSYRPMLTLLHRLTQQHSEFRFALSLSGVFLEQALIWAPDLIKLLRQLVASGQVELLAETYYHSLASLYSDAEFVRQVQLHRRLIHRLFKVEPQVFRNTELVYSNQIGASVAALGFAAMLTEGVPRYLHGRPKTQLYRAVGAPLVLLLKHAELSDDIAFRFSESSWHHFPLNADKYLDWVTSHGEQALINLFMDFETFGEHQWQETGIFAFFEQVVKQGLANNSLQFVTPSQLIPPFARRHQLPVYDVPEPISWADVDRDLTAWLGNPLQHDCVRALYGLESAMMHTNRPELVAEWRRLQTSDHLYYMCTKWAADGDVHAYFSPYATPYEAYRQYSLALAHLTDQTQRAAQLKGTPWRAL